jgi:hypothetical protein
VATPAEAQRSERLALATLTSIADPPSTPPRSPSWRENWLPYRWTLAVATAATILVVVLGLRFRPLHTEAVAPAVAAHVLKSTGLTVSGRPAVVGQAINAGTELVVGAEGHAEISVERGGVVRLFPKSKVRLEGRGEDVMLIAGKVWCVVDPGKGAFRVITDRATARVLGTSFVVEKMPGGATEVRVLAGTVAVEDVQHRAERSVSARQKTSVGPSSPPSPPVAYSGEDDTGQWNLLDFFKSVGRAIKHLFGK